MENPKPKRINKLLLSLTLVVITLPLLQHVFNFPKLRGLKGAFTKVEKPKLSYKSWLDGTYPESADKYMTRNFGFRPNLVRLDNEWNYDLFGEVRAATVVEGKENYLYEQNYIDALMGKDFLGHDIILEKVKLWESLSDSLNARGKEFLVVLAPGKASFFPEFIPGEDGAPADSTNYFSLRDALGESDVEHIDFNGWFMDLKSSAEYPLYPKTGIHWSRYGMLLGADSLARNLAELTGLDLPRIVWNEIEYVDERRHIDDDIEQTMNILHSLPNYKMAYPKYWYDGGEGKKPRGSIIGDSYFWDMLRCGFLQNIFSDGDFWFYNDNVYDTEGILIGPAKKMDIENWLENTDVVIFLATEGNLKYFPWGFDSRLHGYLTEENFVEKERTEAEIQMQMDIIRKNEEWMGFVKQQSENLGIPLEKMLRRNAEYFLKKNSAPE